VSGRFGLVVVDVDGTLIGDREVVCSDTAAALMQCSRDGVAVAVATGRPISSAVRYAELVGAAYVIALNGAAVCDARGEPIWVHDGFDPTALEFFEDLTAWHEVDVSLDGLRVRYALTDVSPSMALMAVRHAVSIIPANVAAITGPALKAQFLGSARALTVVRNALPPSLAASSGSDQYGAFLEVAPSATSKGAAVARLAEHLGVEREQIMAIGDGENDISMCEHAGVTVAVQDSHTSLLARATHQVDVCADDGAVGVALAALLLGDENALTRVQTLRPTAEERHTRKDTQ